MSEQPAAAVRAERGHKRVRAYLGGDLVADTTAPLLVWEHDKYPAYYIPAADVRAELISAGRSERLPRLGEAELLHVKTPTAKAENAARRYRDAPVPDVRDAIRLEWAAMSEWLEEDEPVYVHPRDPYKRVDILASSRRVRIELDGVTVAESAQPRILFETGLPPRYYLPVTALRMDLLRPSAPGRRVDVPDAVAGEPEDRRAGLLLQRAGRDLPGRDGAAAAEVTVQL